tara:strand:- start:157 stop:327 length:171 start_codon:yes stop_codon:yes gene_type:complete
MRGNWILYASGYGVDFFVYGKTDLKSHPIYASAQIKFEQKYLFLEKIYMESDGQTF